MRSDLGPTAGGANGVSFLSNDIAKTAATYNYVDNLRIAEIGPHALVLEPVQYEMLMNGYMKVTCDGSYVSTDTPAKVLQTIHNDYLLKNNNLEGPPNWQVIGLMMESITHTFDVTNAGSTGLSGAEEAAFTLHTDEYLGHLAKSQYYAAADSATAVGQPIAVQHWTGGKVATKFYSGRPPYAAHLEEFMQGMKSKGFTSLKTKEASKPQITIPPLLFFDAKSVI